MWRVYMHSSVIQQWLRLLIFAVDIGWLKFVGVFLLVTSHKHYEEINLLTPFRELNYLLVLLGDIKNIQLRYIDTSDFWNQST